ncbi:ParB/RepB/Spo0J family partition protein (plasmid) [Streptomyces xanthophaeus]|uniref:ParB/RepB/Spo0J family partition protein n=1 Tax=Streptomyces xanthophaeus TaxID=67385 RepID=UPI002F912123|nr:ParB/RepB/Spo0J family partition protein [Streptomyces xanthophaeus]WST65890.1 ParB/RepB/Spo0J family partition protein [Streptomyces xanthophaeus]
MSSKADKLAVSASFARAQPVGVSSRRAAIAEATAAPTSGIVPPSEVPIEALAHNPFNLREELTELEEMAQSLTARGQLQPLAVATRMAFMEAHPGQTDGLGRAPYVVIDGNRRLAAAQLAGLKSMHIHVNDSLATSAADILESALIANIHRVDVAPMDQARALQELVDVHGSQAQVAKRLGKTAAWVSQRLALLQLTPDLQDKVESGELKVEPARRIGRLPQEEQEAAAEATVNAVNPPRQRTRTVNGVNAVNAPAPAPADRSEGTEAVNGVNAVNATPRLTIAAGSPEDIANALAAQLSPDDLKAVTELLVSRI